MNLWMVCGSLLMALLGAFAIGSRCSGRTRPWVARVLFLATAGGIAQLASWTLQYVHVAATPFLVACVGYATVRVACPAELVEDNAPPSAATREAILASHDGLPHHREPRGKRLLDLVLACTTIVATFPLWLLIAMLVWFEEPGPVFFTKNSVGRGGITFRQVKFRSMVYDAERLTGPVAASGDDPRTLRVGRRLRRWHLDELPELLNVVTGRMSLVGPRPLRAVLVDRYLRDVPGFADRHTVRPGIACIAQIEKYHISPTDRLRKDRVYIRRQSLGLDLRLLVRAVATTLHRELLGTPRTHSGSARSSPGPVGEATTVVNEPASSGPHAGPH